jgi:hypothetical protein
MRVVHELLSRWPALIGSARRVRLHKTLRMSPGSLGDALAADANTVEAAANGL